MTVIQEKPIKEVFARVPQSYPLAATGTNVVEPTRIKYLRVALQLVGLIFIFGKMGTSVGGGYGGAAISIALTLFMSTIELLVSFIQAFIFAILSASYIGMAVAEEHH